MKQVVLISILLVSFSLQSQQNLDSLLTVIEKQMIEEKLDAAISQLKTLHNQHSENNRLNALLFRAYYWSNQPAEAMGIYESSETHIDKDADLDLSYLRCAVLNKEYDKAIGLADFFSEKYPKEKNDFQFEKVNSLMLCNRYVVALEILKDLEKADAPRDKIEYFRTMIYQKRKNTIAVKHQQTHFQPNQSYWKFYTLEYERRMPRSTFLLRGNIADIDKTQSLMLEADYYLKGKKKNYTFLNAGGSDGKSFFPLFRLGLEYFHAKKNHEASIGFRYFHFEQTQVYLFTGSLVHYHKQWSVMARPFVVYFPKEWSFSQLVSITHTDEVKERVFQLDLQYGKVPYFYSLMNDYLRYSSYRAGVRVQFRVAKHVFVTPAFMYEYEQYEKDYYRNRYNVMLSLSKRF